MRSRTTFEEVKRRMPPKELLEGAAPLHIWEEAAKQALRSPHKRHRTGCVLTDKSFNIIAKGVAHTHDGGMKVRSIHAEQDALSKCRWEDFTPNCIIVTLTKVGNFAEVSKPCANCAEALCKHCWDIIFCEKANDDSWSVVKTSPSSLRHLKKTRYVLDQTDKPRTQYSC